MDLRKEIENNVAKEIQNEIDWEIMCSMLKECGWVEVKIEWSRMTESLAHEIKEWCRKNLTGAYKAQGRTWLFSKEKDATLFVLRWS